MYSLRKSNNYSLKSAHHKRELCNIVGRRRCKTTLLGLKVSCRRTDNFQPGTTIIKISQYNGILNMTSIM